MLEGRGCVLYTDISADTFFPLAAVVVLVVVAVVTPALVPLDD